jgi:hypothetical protein
MRETLLDLSYCASIDQSLADLYDMGHFAPTHLCGMPHANSALIDQTRQ